MKLAVVAITRQGAALAGKVRDIINASGWEAVLFLPERFASEQPGAYKFKEPLAQKTAGLFQSYHGLVMVMALGIVVRLIAPFVKDKRTDPAVVVLDEKGKFVISALSGHLGGANELARRLAGGLGAIPVVTTATDINGLTAVDVLAKDLHMTMEPFEAVRGVNSALVNGEPVWLYSEYPLPYAPPGFTLVSRGDAGEKPAGAWEVLVTGKSMIATGTHTLLLRPRNLVLGVGCRRGAGAGVILKAIGASMERLGKSPLCIKALATVDIKANEPGILQAAGELGIPLLVYTREEIEEVFRVRGSQLNYSSLVQQKIGVGGVCEPVTLLASPRGRMIQPKTKFPGVTVAVAEESSGWWEQARDRLNI